MEKTFILIRHAKSSWDNLSLKDFDRPLNERGKRDAPKMAAYIASKQAEIDLILCSASNRTRQTVACFLKEWDLSKEQVIYTEDLYLASPIEIQSLIRSVDENVNRLAVIGHNPGMTECVNRIPNVNLDNLPTCGVYTGQYRGSWSSFEFGMARHQSIVYPKILPNA